METCGAVGGHFTLNYMIRRGYQRFKREDLFRRSAWYQLTRLQWWEEFRRKSREWQQWLVVLMEWLVKEVGKTWTNVYSRGLQHLSCITDVIKEPKKGHSETLKHRVNTTQDQDGGDEGQSERSSENLKHTKTGRRNGAKIQVPRSCLSWPACHNVRLCK